MFFAEVALMNRVTVDGPPRCVEATAAAAAAAARHQLDLFLVWLHR